MKESESHSVVLGFLRPHGPYSPWNSPGQNTGVGTHSLLQGIFPTHGSSPGLPHCRQILYQLSHQGSPGILEWGSLSFLQQIFLTQDSNWESPALQADYLLAELSRIGAFKLDCKEVKQVNINGNQP